MESSKLNRWKLLLAGIILNGFFCGIYYVLSRDLYFTVSDLFSNTEIIKINVYALWIPIGFIGPILICISAFVVAFITQKKADQIWGNEGQKIVVRITAIFAVLGLVFAIGMYQWLTSELDERGYVYSKKDSRLSAMGKHEVYIKKADKTDQTL